MVDSWQEEVETGRYVRLAFGAAGATKPTAPTAGSSIDWAATATGEAAFGFTASDFAFAEDDWEFVDDEGDPIIIKPPDKGVNVAKIHDTIPGIKGIAAKSYEAGAKLAVWATNATVAGAVTTENSVFTRASVVAEVAGLGYYYFPSVEIRTGPIEGGYKSSVKQMAHVDVMWYSGYPSGWDWTSYADA